MRKDEIKKILRENSALNAKGVAITRPDQELIVMRGIPGSGKSTKAKEIVGEGVIHSTDDLIEATGDYRKFFADMVENKDFGPHGKMHSKNFTNAVASMKEGVTPVIVDNTNLKAFEPKGYVEAALDLGFDDKNIKFVDIGTAGLDANALFERNTHGVPLDKIEQMMKAHKSSGELTVKKVMEAKSKFGNKKPKIAMVLLDDKSQSKLFTALAHKIPKGWDVHVHHMTINFGKGLGPERSDEAGRKVNLIADGIFIGDLVIAVRISGYPADSGVPHVTIAVNSDEGGKPAMASKITQWEDLTPHINVSGEIQDVDVFQTPTTKR